MLQKKTQVKFIPKLRPSWRKATEEEKLSYNNVLEIKLKNMVTSSSEICKDVHCNNVHHIQEIDTLVVDILKSIDVSAASCLPKPQRKKTSKPMIKGWKDEVEPFRDKAMFWHAMWESAGRPLNNELHAENKKFIPP